MLSESQQKTLRAVVDRIIPPDDYPGAWEAGVGDYLARQFERDLRDLLPTYREGLDALEAETLAQQGAAFPDLTADQQDALLRRIESGEVQTDWPVPPQRFFLLLVSHTAEGYYSDPENGGNHDALSWKMIGFEK